MAAESDLLGVMVIAAWAVHSETAKGMEYSASRYLAYLMRNPGFDACIQRQTAYRCGRGVQAVGPQHRGAQPRLR